MKIGDRAAVKAEPVISYCQGFRIIITITIDDGNDIGPLNHIRSLLPFDRWRFGSHSKLKCHVHGLTPFLIP